MQAKAAIAAGNSVVVQFAAPPPSDQIAAIDALAATAPDRVTLRFYGFYGTSPFDAAMLPRLRNIRHLQLNCLRDMANIAALERVHGLHSLSLEVWDLTDKDILHRIDPSQMTSLSIGDMNTKAIDGTALARFAKLEEVFLSNSVKSHDSLAGLPHLRSIRLRARPRDSYAFVANCPALQLFEFFLGGCPDLSEMRSDTLRDLRVIRCRGAEDLGDLTRFPKLGALAVEDQIKVTALDLRGATELQKLQLINCKTLHALRGLEALPDLTDLWVYGTALDLDALEAMDRDWTRLGLFSGKLRDDGPREARLQARGLGVFTPDPEA